MRTTNVAQIVDNFVLLHFLFSILCLASHYMMNKECHLQSVYVSIFSRQNTSAQNLDTRALLKFDSLSLVLVFSWWISARLYTCLFSFLTCLCLSSNCFQFLWSFGLLCFNLLSKHSSRNRLSLY